MKVPDKNPLEQQNNDINDVTLYRKKKKKAKLIRNFIIWLVIVAAASARHCVKDTDYNNRNGRISDKSYRQVGLQLLCYERQLCTAQ